MIYLAHKSGRTITALHLSKLLYLAEALSLAADEGSLFDDPIEANRYSPHIVAVYQEFFDFGSKPIRKSALESNYERGYTSVNPYCFTFLNRNDKDLLKETFDVFVGGGYSLEALYGFINESEHGETPWKEAIKKGEYSQISRESMKKFFERYIDKGEENEKQEAI
jgi:uncharacterized phage-associated protein